MKKILIISNMYPSEKYPHYGVFVKNTEDILIANDYDVKVISMEKEDKKISKLKRYFRFYLESIIGLVFSEYDCVYVHFASFSSLPVLLINKVKKMNIITNIHGNDLVPDNSKDKRMLIFSKKLFKISNKIIVPSEYFKQELLQIDYHYEKKIYVYPSGGIDTNVFKPVNKNEARRYFGLNPEDTYIGFIGRIEQDKGWDIFVNLANKFKDKKIKFIVVGNGTEEIELEKKIKELGLQKIILRFKLMNQEKINLMLNSLDFLVFPTRRKSESLGLIGLESMATNTILLSSDKYGPSSYTRDNENCLTFNPYEEDSLYDSLNKALRLTDKEKQQIKEKSHETIKEYEVEKVSSKLLKIIGG